MPTLRERFANLLLGPEKQRLEQSVKMLYEAYQDGPFQLPPDELMRQLRETDSAILADLLAQLQYDYLGSFGSYQTESDAARKRAVDESRRLWDYAPLAWWTVNVWTNFGLGESVSIVCDDPEADKVFQECWKADRNAELFADDRLQELSNWTLIDGNVFLAAFASVYDGTVTWTELPYDEIVEIITDPNNKRRPLFYKRQFADTKGETHILYYPNWQAYFETPDDLDKFDLPKDGLRADQVDGNTLVCVLHISHNRKNRKSLWGYPILAMSAPYTRAHKKFLEDRLTISAAKAMYVRKAKVTGGSRAVAAVKRKLQSALTSSNSLETNPPAATGSTLVENQAVDTTDFPMSTGAGDAKSDNEMFTWMALIGMGLFPTSAGLDTSRWATALAMDKTQAMQWSRYQTFWSSQFSKIVKVTLLFKQKSGPTYQTLNAQVSTDSFSIVDFPGVVTSMSQLIQTGITPLVTGGVVPTEAGRLIVQHLWRVALKALGVDDEDLTSDETFQIQGAAQEAQPSDTGRTFPGKYRKRYQEISFQLAESGDTRFHLG